MARHRTAMGKSIDMAGLIARNEKTRAVGNKSVNARGDSIDQQGRVVFHASSLSVMTPECPSELLLHAAIVQGLLLHQKY